jgi:hypothetical protein
MNAKLQSLGNKNSQQDGVVQNLENTINTKLRRLENTLIARFNKIEGRFNGTSYVCAVYVPYYQGRSAPPPLTLLMSNFR